MSEKRRLLPCPKCDAGYHVRRFWREFRPLLGGVGAIAGGLFMMAHIALASRTVMYSNHFPEFDLTMAFIGLFALYGGIALADRGEYDAD